MSRTSTHFSSRTITLFALSAASAVFAACGGTAGEALISGSVTGEYKGTEFTVENGFAYQASSSLIVLGDGPLNCDSATAPDPPSGHFASITLPSFDAGEYMNVAITVYRNEGSFEGAGTNTGTVEITESSADSVAGSVAFEYDDDGDFYALNGTFEVVRCSQ